MRVNAVAMAMLFAAFPALAFDTTRLGQGGSLPLSDIMPLIGKYPALKRDVDGALAAGGKSADAVTCDGMRFPGSWVSLGGERVAPYTCDFGSKWLVIDATVRLTGKRGRVFETIDSAAMQNATKASETRLTWRWTTEDPTKER
jgi:hypothetical protein